MYIISVLLIFPCFVFRCIVCVSHVHKCKIFFCFFLFFSVCLMLAVFVLHVYGWPALLTFGFSDNPALLLLVLNCHDCCLLSRINIFFFFLIWGWVSACKNLFLPHMKFKPAETWYNRQKLLSVHWTNFFWYVIATCTKLHFKSKIHIDCAVAICFALSKMTT